MCMLKYPIEKTVKSVYAKVSQIENCKKKRKPNMYAKVSRRENSQKCVC